MSEPNSPEVKTANHFYARGGVVRRAPYLRIPADERFIPTDPAMRQRSLNLLRESAKQFGLSPLPNGPHPVVLIGQEREVCICGEPALALTHQAQGTFTVPPELAAGLDVTKLVVWPSAPELPERLTDVDDDPNDG